MWLYRVVVARDKDATLFTDSVCDIMLCARRRRRVEKPEWCDLLFSPVWIRVARRKNHDLYNTRETQYIIAVIVVLFQQQTM